MYTYLSELFSSIQGEGPFIGERHFFIRFCGCHRRCVFCDTDVERSKNIMIEKIPGSGVIDCHPNPISSTKILELINIIDKERNCKKISITGGEPLLQEKFLYELLPILRNDNREIYLETSGDLTRQLESIVEWINYASVDIKNGNLIEAGSRTIAVLGVEDTIEKAEKVAEKKITKIEGPLFHRKDIGTSSLISKRVKHMDSLR